MANEVRVEGVDEILRKLRLLPERIGRNAMRRSLRKGANVIRDAARNNAKRFDDAETREAIWKNIAVQSGGKRREKQEGGVMMRVGVRGGAKSKKGSGGGSSNPGGDTWYFRLLEFGTSKMAAQPFLRPAAAENVGRVSTVVANDMQTQLDKEIAKLT